MITHSLTSCNFFFYVNKIWSNVPTLNSIWSNLSWKWKQFGLLISSINRKDLQLQPVIVCKVSCLLIIARILIKALSPRPTLVKLIYDGLYHFGALRHLAHSILSKVILDQLYCKSQESYDCIHTPWEIPDR